MLYLMVYNVASETIDQTKYSVDVLIWRKLKIMGNSNLLSPLKIKSGRVYIHMIFSPTRVHTSFDS